MIPLLILMIAMGVYPRPFLDRTQAAVRAIEQRVMHGAGGTVAEK
jgi:NADH:ubiquinone oxidoreductase subunit 4 (subunit M)